MKIQLKGKAYLSVVLDKKCQISYIFLFDFDKIDIGEALKLFLNLNDRKMSLKQKRKFSVGQGKQAEINIKDVYRFAAWFKDEIVNKKTP